jgi:hypothetical protein
MRALKFVADLSFQEDNLPVSTPQNSTNREILALSRSHYRIRHCSIAVALSCISEVNSVQITLKRWVVVPISSWSRLQWIWGIEEEIAKISLISLGVKDRVRVNVEYWLHRLYYVAQFEETGIESFDYQEKFEEAST